MKELSFTEFENKNEFILLVLYDGNQIGLIKQNDNSKFFVEFKKSEFYWLDYILKEEGEIKSFDLEELKTNILNLIKEVYDCF